MHSSKPSPTPGPPQHTSVPPQPCQRPPRVAHQHCHAWSPQAPPVQARAAGTLGALAHTAAASAGSVEGTWSSGQRSGAIKMLQEVLMMFCSYLWFAIASAAKSLCKTPTDHAASCTTQGLGAIAMHWCQKTKEMPLSRGRLLKSIHEKIHSEDAHRQTASSESLCLQGDSLDGQILAQANGFSEETGSAGALGLVQHPQLTLEGRWEVTS